MTKAENVFNKIAKKLNISNLEEDYLGGALLSDSGEMKAKKLYAEQVNNSFALRHPVLTGIPTLGIAPMLADDKAFKSVARRMLKDDTKLRKAYDVFKKEERKHNYHLQEARASAPVSNTNISTTIDKSAGLGSKASGAFKKTKKFLNEGFAAATSSEKGSGMMTDTAGGDLLLAAATMTPGVGYVATKDKKVSKGKK